MMRAFDLGIALAIYVCTNIELGLANALDAHLWKLLLMQALLWITVLWWTTWSPNAVHLLLSWWIALFSIKSWWHCWCSRWLADRWSRVIVYRAYVSFFVHSYRMFLSSIHIFLVTWLQFDFSPTYFKIWFVNKRDTLLCPFLLLLVQSGNVDCGFALIFLMCDVKFYAPFIYSFLAHLAWQKMEACWYHVWWNRVYPLVNHQIRGFVIAGIEFIFHWEEIYEAWRHMASAICLQSCDHLLWFLQIGNCGMARHLLMVVKDRSLPRICNWADWKIILQELLSDCHSKMNG